METGWLIEKDGSANKECGTGLFIGECNGAIKWTTANLAIRFARKEDAHAAARAFDLKGTLATDHEWV